MSGWRHAFRVIAVLLTWSSVVFAGPDPRFIDTATLILRDGYADQPYVVQLHDGRWLCVTTVSPTEENAPERHLVLSWSADQGRTWTEPQPGIEPPAGMRQPSWATLFVNEAGRVYAFYNVNREQGRGVQYVFRYSDDEGGTWSDRYELPVRETEMDRAFSNASSWGIDPPQQIGDHVFFAFSKYGGPNRQGEGWVFRSPNLWSEPDASALIWEMWPAGDIGIRSERVGYLQEEHNLVPLADGTLYMMARSLEGYVIEAWSDDAGETWTEPQFATYADGVRRIKNPRALARVWRCRNGKYLLWYHHHDGRDVPARNKNRTPAWVSGGIEQDGRIRWSQPEILLYTFDPPHNSGMSYPDLIEHDGRYFITQTQKKVARISEVDAAMLQGVWEQFEAVYRSDDDLLAEANNGMESLAVALPSLANQGSFTISLQVRVDDLAATHILFDGRQRDRMGNPGRGIVISATGRGTLALAMNDGRRSVELETDDGRLVAGQDHIVSFMVDGRARIITAVVDEWLCDGGVERQYGWQLFGQEFMDVAGAGTIRLHESIMGARIYGRALRTSEVIAHHRYTSGRSE
jgi:hypothetical protein